MINDNTREELRQQLVLEEIKTQRKCSECDSMTTQSRHRRRRKDGAEVVYENWHDDGNGSALCHNCYLKRWRASKNKQMGRPRKVLSQTAMKNPEQQHDIDGYVESTFGFMSLREIVRKFPPGFKNKDIFDLLAHVLDALVVTNGEVEAISLRNILMLSGLNHTTLADKLAILAESEMIQTTTHLKTGTSLFKVTPKGHAFLKIYRKIAELVAWIE